MAAQSLADYMQAVARNAELAPPTCYGYKADLGLGPGLGCFVDERTSCKVLERPMVIPSGKKLAQGYMVLFAYCQKEGLASLLQGQLPPRLPATAKEPKDFESLAAIADNFGAKDPQSAAGNSEFCMAMVVPAELATKAETPGRDLWLVRLDLDPVSPFLQAAREGNLEAVRQGLKQLPGELVDENGVSALMMASFGGFAEVCEALLQKGGEVRYAEPLGGKTPLMFAAQGGFEQVVKLLLDAGADPAQADKEGCTALMWSATAGKTGVARLLSPLGGREATNGQGLTAKALAEQLGHKETAAALA